jgi:hypothetical protein
MTLANRLAALDEDDQGALAYKEAPVTAPAQLVEALQLPGLGLWAKRHITHELTHRGPSLADPIAQALLAQPVGPGAAPLSDALVELFGSEPAARERVIRALIDAGNAAFDMGGSTHNAGIYVAQLADCVTLGGPLPEAGPLARRLLDAARTEADPYTFGVMGARKIAGDS